MLSIAPVSPPTFTGIEAGPNAKLLVRGVATHSTVEALTWSWTVTSTVSGMNIITTATDKSRSTVEFPILRADTFQIVASVDNLDCLPTTKTVTTVVSKPGFRFRTTASNFPVQEQRIDRAAGSSVRIDLQSGRQYLISPLQADQSSNLLSGYLRLMDAGGNFRLEANTTHGPLTATLLSGTAYNLLVVPDDNTVAPMLVPNGPPEALQGFSVDRGLHVGGRALDANGDPIVGARMILKNGDLPSTVGLSDANGQMELWARAGTVAAIVVPPTGLGLPQARVDLASDGSGIVVPPSSSSLTLTMRWAAAARGPLTISVLGVDGTSAVSGARVHVSMRPSTTPVGVMTASGGGAGDLGFSAMGSNNAELTSDTKGQVRFAMLPVGTYDVTVTPPNGLALVATTGLSVTLPAAGLSRSVTLAQKVNLTGTTSQGASVTAIDISPDASGTTVTAIAGSDGAFTLSVDPGRNYELILQPRPGQALGRRVIRETSVAASGSSLGSIPLPPAVTVTGNVMNAGKPVVDAFVQVFCVSTSATCADPAISLGDVTTLPDGSFTLVLPDLAAPN